MLSLHDTEAVTALGRQLRVEPLLLRRFRNAIYKQGATPAAALTLLPAAARAEFARQVQCEFLELAQRQDSARDGATKCAWRTADGRLLESVLLRIRSGRTSLCVSSQIGCAGGCRFCATGTLGLVRNLTVDEILDQVLQASRMLRAAAPLPLPAADPDGDPGPPPVHDRLRNVVFMGMGEPFHNEANLYRALELLQAPTAFNLSSQKLTVSTLGVPEAMERCAARFPAVYQAVSLHSAREEVRRVLMPLTARYPLARLRQAIEALCTAAPGRKVMIEYLLLQGVNDGPADLAALLAFLAGLPAHINLIQFNATAATSGCIGTTEAARQAFARPLRAAGFTVTLRYSLGADIAAACGQLAAAPGSTA